MAGSTSTNSETRDSTPSNHPPDVAGDSADARAEHGRQQRATRARRERRARAVQQAREDVATVAVGAEQQQRRADVGIGGHERAGREPSQRDLASTRPPRIDARGD